MRQEDAEGGVAVMDGIMKKGRTPHFLAAPLLQHFFLPAKMLLLLVLGTKLVCGHIMIY